MKILFVGAMDCEIDYIKSQMSNVETKVCQYFFKLIKNKTDYIDFFSLI